MSVFNIHDDDGRVTQSNKVYDPAGYDKILDQYGMRFVVSGKDTSPHQIVERMFVDKGKLKERPRCKITISATTIKPGEAFKIGNVPLGAMVTISTDGLTIFHDKTASRTIEVQIPVPCTYKVSVEAFPHIDFHAEVRAG
jgi:hypothetical protein